MTTVCSGSVMLLCSLISAESDSLKLLSSHLLEEVQCLHSLKLPVGRFVPHTVPSWLIEGSSWLIRSTVCGHRHLGVQVLHLNIYLDA